MKIFFLLFLLITFAIHPHNIPNHSFAFQVKSPVQQYEKIKIQSLLLGEKQNKAIETIAKTIKYDLEFTDQIKTVLKKTNQELDNSIEQKLIDKGVSLFLYIKPVFSSLSSASNSITTSTNKSSGKGDMNNNKIKISVKDPFLNTNVFEKEYTFNPNNLVIESHKISDELLETLTGEKGICLHTLAYCKMINTKRKTICIADYACKKEKTLIANNTINTAPCWHTKAPVLFFSQFTQKNNRLMSINLKTRKRKVICSYDGLNMQPSFSSDGKKAALCLSGGKNSELYLYDYSLCKKLKKRVFIPLTKNRGNNVSPCLLENEDIIFCSDFQTRLPQLYYLNRSTNKTKRLTNGKGYCAAPSYCAKNNSLVYTRAIKGTFQLFLLNLDNLNNLEEKQITFNRGNKHEPAFSECGRFIAFSYDVIDKNQLKIPQIAVLNRLSGKIRVLTTGKEPKSFPKWGSQVLYKA